MAAFAALAIIAFGAMFFVLRQNRTSESTVARQSEPTTETKSETAQIENTEGQIEVPENNSENPVLPENSNKQNLNRNTRKTTPASNTVKNNPGKEINAQAPALQNELALNTADFELYPNEVVRSGETDLRKIRVKSNARQIRLKLKAPSVKNFSRFRAEITDSQNKIVLSQRIVPAKDGSFVLIVPQKNLPASTYSVKIYASQNKSEELFTEYGFEVEYP
jgi:hypothetical protein